MRPEDLIFKPKHALDPDQVLDRLKQAADSKNANEIGQVMLEVFSVGVRPEFVPVLIDLLSQERHYKHEDIISAFQTLKDPRTVEVIYRASFIRHDYLDYDDTFGLARKCTWALADIGTEEALAKLRLLAKSENSMVSGYAQKRIDNWELERHRKRAA